MPLQHYRDIASATARVPNLQGQPITLSGYQRLGAVMRRHIEIARLARISIAGAPKNVSNRSRHATIMAIAAPVSDESN